MTKQGITPKEALGSKRDFYVMTSQGNGYYPIDKFVYHPESDSYEQFVQKTSGWHSWGIAYEKPTKYTDSNGKENTVTNRSWWLYIFEHKACIISFDEMSDNKSYNLN